MAQWKEALISPYPIFLHIVPTSSEFFEWIDTIGYKRPTFWSCPFDEHSEQRRATDGTIPRIEITKEQPKGKKSCAAWKAINSRWPDGPPENCQTARIHREVNKWIEKQPREKYPFTEVSREVVARLLHRK
jgi:hypothetical protein